MPERIPASPPFAQGRDEALRQMAQLKRLGAINTSCVSNSEVADAMWDTSSFEQYNSGTSTVFGAAKVGSMKYDARSLK